MKTCRILAMGAVMFLAACGPSQQDMAATATQVAAEVYASETAAAPTATASVTPSSTVIPSSTPSATPTSEPTRTPGPPTPTLTEQGVTALLYCYQAAVSVRADWAVHRIILPRSRGYSDAKFQKLNAFLYERSHRSGKVRILPDSSAIVVSGVDIKDIDGGGACNPYLSDILSSSESLRWGTWGVGAVRRLELAESLAKDAARDLRASLLEHYGVSYSTLDAIEDPIWYYVYKRYGVEFPY
jgi:hypothetical protein